MAHLYYNMVCKVFIGSIQLMYVNEVTVTESIKLLSNTAKVVIPRDYREASINGRPGDPSRPDSQTQDPR